MEALIIMLFGFILPCTLCPMDTKLFLLIDFSIYLLFVGIEILVEYKKESIYNKNKD